MSKVVVRSVLSGIEKAMVTRANDITKAHWDLNDRGMYETDEAAMRADLFVQGFRQATTELQQFLAVLFDDDALLDTMDSLAGTLTAPADDSAFPGLYL